MKVTHSVESFRGKVAKFEGESWKKLKLSLVNFLASQVAMYHAFWLWRLTRSDLLDGFFLKLSQSIHFLLRLHLKTPQTTSTSPLKLRYNQLLVDL
jgi:hypothetical protein